MRVCYDKLWKQLIDRKMNKGDLRVKAGMGPSTLAKLGKEEKISMDVIMRICEALNCDVGDIMEIMPDKGDEKWVK